MRRMLDLQPTAKLVRLDIESQSRTRAIFVNAIWMPCVIEMKSLGCCGWSAEARNEIQNVSERQEKRVAAEKASGGSESEGKEV